MELEKVTKRERPSVRRVYDDACGTAHALHLIGERWAMLIIRELAFGPRRFSELKADLPGISANVLTQRLGELESRGIVRKISLPPPASVQVYEATPWGLEAAPLIGALGKWAARSPDHDPSLPMSHAALMMSFETLFDPARAADMDARLGFRFGNVDYVATVRCGSIRVERRPIEDVDVTFTGTPMNMVAAIHGGAPPEQVDVRVEGSPEIARRFMSLFPLPPKAF
ncbi:MAG TPA: winged helix-turn-helix transcriptional regulator [Sphingomicrobium sp.]